MAYESKLHFMEGHPKIVHFFQTLIQYNGVIFSGERFQVTRFPIYFQFVLYKNKINCLYQFFFFFLIWKNLYVYIFSILQKKKNNLHIFDVVEWKINIGCNAEIKRDHLLSVEIVHLKMPIEGISRNISVNNKCNKEFSNPGIFFNKHTHQHIQM